MPQILTRKLSKSSQEGSWALHPKNFLSYFKMFTVFPIPHPLYPKNCLSYFLANHHNLSLENQGLVRLFSLYICQFYNVKTVFPTPVQVPGEYPEGMDN